MEMVAWATEITIWVDIVIVDIVVDMVIMEDVEYLGTGRGRRRYRGEETIEDMHEMYKDYSEGREEYGRGNYGAKEGTMKSLDYMLQSVVEFVEMLKRDASSQEEAELIQKYTRQISEM